MYHQKWLLPLSLFFLLIITSGFFVPRAVAGVVVIHVGLADTSTALTSSHNPTQFGDSITLTAIVSGGAPTGQVSFTKDGASIDTHCLSNSNLTLNNGQASCVINHLSVGNHNLAASYSGDTYHQSSASTVVVQQINKAITTTTLISSATPSSLGNTLILTATVSGATPSGTVSFLDGDTSINASCIHIGDVALNGSQATCTLDNLGVGTHHLKAYYAGDTNNLFSFSSTLLQAILPISPVTIITGDEQSTPINQLFDLPLEVLVSNSSGQPVVGASVVFTVSPSNSGAAATLSSSDSDEISGPQLTATTDSEGKARVFATANNTVGSYVVTSTVCTSLDNLDTNDLIMCARFDATPATFHLTNT